MRENQVILTIGIPYSTPKQCIIELWWTGLEYGSRTIIYWDSEYESRNEKRSHGKSQSINKGKNKNKIITKK